MAANVKPENNLKMEKEKHICKKCSKYFQSHIELRNHTIQTHKKEKKYSCHICDKCFTGREYLTKHMENIHQGPNHLLL